MGLNFPSAPTIGQAYPSPAIVGVPQFIWNGSVWNSGADYNVVTAAEYIANSAPTKVVASGAVWSAVATLPNISDTSGTITLDMAACLDFYTLLTGVGRTLAAPTNAIKTGQKGVIYLAQDGTGGRTITTWHSAWKFPGGLKPTLSAASGAVDVISYVILSNTFVLCTFNPDFR
jgi:hypothetical protein